MKIVNVIQGTDLGGMEQASLRLMIGLQGNGHSCEVISLNPIGELGPLLKEHNIPATGLPYLGKGGWRSFFLVRHTLRNVNADCLLMTGHHLLTMLALGDMCQGRRLLAVHFHHKGVKPAWQWRLIYHMAFSRFNAITFPSDFVRNEAEELYPPIKSLSHTVYNPLTVQYIPTNEQRHQARLALGLKIDVPLIGNAGWLIPRKRFDIFLRTAQLILRRIPNALFLIAGDGEERARLEALARNLGITEQVKWLGWQQDLTQFYQCLDLMLFNSDWDALATTPLEGVSRGIPLVASNLQGGLKEILNTEEYGFLISKHDIEALAEKAIYFLQNPHEARKVSQAGKERVEQVSNSKKIVEEIESLLTRASI